MSDNSLPDEIISEILSPALKVPDELFSDNSDVSPFATNSESTSAYLLVCKSWLRVATPLLYNVVILRSKAQAKALSLALSQNPDLGRFIKKLRVEGGYGPPMRIILQCAPNITDLFLSFVIYSSDSTSGLCKGLPLINPTRLILRDLFHRPLENKMISQLTEALIQSLPKWDRLVRSTLFNPAQYLLMSSLCSNRKRLHTLTIPEATGLSWVYSTLKGCPLRAIHIKQPLKQWDRIDKTDPVLMALVKYTEAPARGTVGVPEPTSELPPIPPSLNPFFIPMAEAPKEVQDKIWTRILYFAMLGSLQRVTLSANDLTSETFLKAHGPKLTEIVVPYTKLKVKIFELCPNLHSVTLSHMRMGDIPVVDDLDPPQTFPPLVKIILSQNYWTRHALICYAIHVSTEIFSCSSNKDWIAEWDDFFVKFEPERLPNLREIEFNSCVWPTTERDISKSCWVRWAEILLKRGINLTDKTGTRWRPRLKVK
ncbi:F-box domain-containing protein [Mycena sanguinolenta]|uniref:F-box domain-containing protein n=1 Tax=Mycena sanguinolenta TaxID=230812 RepID=A0A8H6X692_9AGAR|nr:F-box domain-containing protein [Mycena sanguinolenta]